MAILQFWLQIPFSKQRPIPLSWSSSLNYPPRFSSLCSLTKKGNLASVQISCCAAIDSSNQEVEKFIGLDTVSATQNTYTSRKVYRFGYGLSYSKYLYKFVSITQTTLFLSKISSTGFTLQNSDSVHYTSVTNIETESCKNGKFSATVSVQNHGEMEGMHPVLLFVNQNDVENGKPMKQLAGFESVKTKGGERVQVEFVINPCEHFTTANEEGLMVIEEGSRYLSVGDQQYPISVLP